MTSHCPVITGIGSVTPYGTLAGLIPPTRLDRRPLTAWPGSGVRLAYSVSPFRPTDVVPGLKTRRLDRLCVWSLVAASLAIKDAGLDLNQVDRSRVAVVCATGLGCVELTEAYFHSAADHGWSHTDPILFPETLGNAPASHVARTLDLRGPNLTVTATGFGGECALLQAASLLRNGQANRVIVLAGDTTTQATEAWYETAGARLIPSEGVTAVVLEPPDTGRRSYAVFRSGHFTSSPDPAAVLKRVLEAAQPDRDYVTASRDAVSDGMRDTGALLRLVLALPAVPPHASLLMLSSSKAGSAALLLELPG